MTAPARRPEQGPQRTSANDEGRPAADDTTGPSADQRTSAPVLVEPPSPSEKIASASATWRAALVEAAGGSTLADVELLGEAALDLSAAHPSGIAQLFAGRETRLSNLVREGAALASARRRARAVTGRAATYAQQYGIAPTYLAIGVASWTERTTPDVASDDVAALATATRESTEQADAPDSEGPAAVRRVRAPVLLRPVSVHARGTAESDYELALEPSLEVNPVLARALRSRGALLDPGAVARSAFTGAGFNPSDALARLSALGDAVLEDFALTDRIVVGTFVHPGQILVDDLDNLTGSLEHHEVVAALAGVDAAVDALRVELPDSVVGDRDPAAERGVGDLDPAQQRVLDVVAAGTHVFIDAPAGSDTTGTLAAVVADAAAAGRTVLYVPGHRRAAIALRTRLEKLGVGDLLLDIAPDAGWRTATARRLLGAMTLEAEAPDPAVTQRLRSDLVLHRERLRAYVAALHAVRAPWDVSAYDALQALARLTSARPAPRTTVRLAPDVARMLDRERRGTLAAELGRAAELAAFSLRPVDTPWFGADLLTESDAADVLRRLERLAGPEGLSRVQERIAAVAADTGFTAATTLDGWARQLEVLSGVRGALDVFQPMVFERSAADMVAATASSSWRESHGVTMGYWLRRRLRKQAKDLVRPGRPVEDLHTALVDVQHQREVWQEHCPAGGWPRLPDDLAAIEHELRAVRADLEVVSRAIATTPDSAGLLDAPLGGVAERVGRLLAGRDALDTLPERTRIVRSLASAGLEDLLRDLARRRVGTEIVADELELAWWSTVFEQVLAADPALAGYEGQALGRLAQEYRDLDLAHVESLAGPVRTRVVAHIRAAMAAHPEQAESLFGELVEDRLTSIRETFAHYPDVARRLRPVMAAAPMLVPQVLPPSRTVDLVVLDAAAHLPVEVALAALARGRQVVVVGDPRCASGTAVRELAAVLPTVQLRADASRRDPYLTAFLAAHGYGDVLSPTPLPDAAPLVLLEVVDGTGMPDAKSGVVDSTRADVDRVVERVIEHTLLHPEESLAVVTASAVHTAQIRDAVLSQMRESPLLAATLDGSRPEPFVVTDLTSVAGLRRDALILSLGYGRTPHGRVLHRFGPLSAAGGDALLLAALGVTRHRLEIISSFAAGELDTERLRGPGPRLLAELLDFADRRGRDELDVRDLVAGGRDEDAGTTDAADAADRAGATAIEGPVGEGSAQDAPVPAAADAGSGVARTTVGAANQGDPAPDRLVVDLAERLWRHGLVVEIDHGLPGGMHIPMAVGHPDVPGALLVAVLTDDAAYVAEPSIRVRDRQAAGRLEKLGWSVVRVWSAAAFLDPQAEVDRIRRAVHAAADQRLAEAGHRPAILPAPTHPPVIAPAEPIEAGGAAASNTSEPTGLGGVGAPVPTEAPTASAPSAVAPAAPKAEEVKVAPTMPANAPVAAAPADASVAPVPRAEEVKVAPAPHLAGAVPTPAAPVGGMVPPAPKAAVADAAPAPVKPPMVGPAPAATPSAEEVKVTGVAKDGRELPVERASAKASSASGSAARSRAEQPMLPLSGLPRPDVRPGLPISAYSDDQLDELVGWLAADGTERTAEELATATRAELGITRRSSRVDSVIAAAVRRATS